MGFLRFLRDLPQLKRDFAELGPEGWRNLLMPKTGQHDALARRAWPVFIKDYDLGEGEGSSIPRDAAQAYMAALKAGRVPRWVEALGVSVEIKRATGGEET
ncbi:hypothetical protein [Deinococcus actinosclerus]|uniref:Uncharacterized protein n=1 Tax=Deinococcus actinosclerus TaxID=1768108 RepID=A0ABN4K8P6_9DEIO|nr:hypothetical protein [Deinococcus actinosclerus]ALW89617.1 hypothetical protein AUC44_12510 [Deinococcus actinosclerus]